MTHDDKNLTLSSFTDVFADEMVDSQPISLSPSVESQSQQNTANIETCYEASNTRPQKHTGQYGNFRSVDEIDAKYRSVFTYPFFNLVQSNVIEDALYSGKSPFANVVKSHTISSQTGIFMDLSLRSSGWCAQIARELTANELVSDKSMVLCAPTGSGKTVVFEMAIVQLLMELEDKNYTDDFKIIYMAPVKAICTERLTEWYSKFTKLGLLCIEVTGDTDVDFSQLKPYRIIITTPEKWDILTRRWTDYRGLVGVIKLFLIDEVHILNDETRGPVLETVVSRMKTIESSSQSAYRIEQLQSLQKRYRGAPGAAGAPPRIRFVVVSATVSNPQDVAAWLSTSEKPAVYHKFGDECRPVKIKRLVEGYPCGEGTSIFKFDIILNYKLWPIIQKYYDGKPTLIFCNTRKSVAMTAETLARELTINFNAEQRAKLHALASTMKTKKLQALVSSGVGCHHAGLLFEERVNIEQAFRNKDLPILITTTTLAMGVNLPAHLVIIKNTQQYVSGAYQEYSISTVLQMVGRAGRPQFDTEATAVIMTRLQDKQRYQALVGGSEPLQSYLHKRLPESLNSEAALRTVTDVAQCVQWLRSTFLYVRAAGDPRRYLGLPPAAAPHQISKKIEELCVRAMNGLATAGLITMDEASCIESTEAGRLMSVYYLDFETMKLIMKIEGTESLEQLLWAICQCHELADMHLRTEERRCLNALNRNSAAATIRFPMKGKITTRQMKLNCVIQAVLGCLSIPDPSLNQESMRIMRIAERVCKCLTSYTTRRERIASRPRQYSAVLNAVLLGKCLAAQLWEGSPFVSKQLRGVGPALSNLLATAGKVTFALLEEAHPRDLERIMNRNAPAGNVLRKQVSLLPKYKLTMSPVDERTVSVELSLLNQSHLADNMDALTAGDGHKSYVLVGDSENHVLLLDTFRDNNLITVFDGTITHTVTRKHRFEHKVFAHCISSTIAGIDVQAEYLFKDLDPKIAEINTKNAKPIDETSKRTATKQTNITDTFTKRKRRNNEIDICQSKEKKKRNNAMIDKLNTLKKSFGRTTKELQEDLVKSKELSDSLLNDIGHTALPTTSSNGMGDVSHFEFDKDFESNFRNDSQEATGVNISVTHEEKNPMDDSRIDSLLNNIENEISKTVQQPKTSSTYFEQKNGSVQQLVFSKLGAYKNNMKSRSVKPPKKADNYSFIELLEKNVDLSDDEVIVEQQQKTGFSETIKRQIQQYLQKARTTTTQTPSLLNDKLLHAPDISYKEESSKTSLSHNVSNAQADPILIHKHVDTHEDTVISDKDNELPECLLQDSQAGFAEQLTQILEDHDDATSNQSIHNDIIQLDDNKILARADWADKLTQDILENQEASSFNNNRNYINEIEDETLDGAEEKPKECEYDHQIKNNYNNINIYDVITIHDQLNKRYLNNQLNNDKEKSIYDKNNISVVRALFRNMSTDDDSLDTIIRSDARDAIPANDKSIKETRKLSSDVVNFATENDKESAETTHKNGEDIVVPLMNKQNTVTDNFSKLSFNYRVPSTYGNVKTRNQNKDAYNGVDSLVPIGYNYDNAEVRNLVHYNDKMSSTLATSQTWMRDVANGHQYSKAPFATALKASEIQRLIPFDNEHRVESDNTLVQYQEPNTSESYAYCSIIQEPSFETPAAVSLTNFPTFTRNRIVEQHDDKKATFQGNCSCNTKTKNNSPLKEANKTNVHHMKKITYTEIDVWTKQNKRSTLQVTKKFKVDLDITEIVSEENQRYGRYERYAAENHCGESESPLTPNDTQRNDISINHRLTVKDVNLQVKELKSSFVPKTYKNFATQDSPRIDKNYMELNPNRVTNDEKAIDTIKADMQTPVEDLGRSAVENILQKYANVLRNKTAEPSQLIISQPQTKGSSQTKSQKIKLKRPFKISDIHRMEATLPEGINAVSTATTPPLVITPTLSNARSLSEQSSDLYNMQPNTRCNTPTNQLFKENAPVGEQFESTHLDKTFDSIEEPAMSESCGQDHFSIDHTMLDPKMLLQSYTNKPQEELPVIPPPPQFCDTQDSYFTSGNYNYEPSSIVDSVQEKSNFVGEYEGTVKTAPNEFETWTFDEDQVNYAPAEPLLLNKCTISKHPIASHNRHNNIKSIALRNATLGQFKFNNKQKFNVRRK